MAKDTFKFKPEQRADLLKYCWTRKADKLLAEPFLDSVESCIAAWLPETSTPPTSAHLKIKHAERLHTAAAEMRAALEAMPPDVAGLLNIGWLRNRYGEDYFKWHNEACRKDKESQISHLYQVYACGLAGKEMPVRITECSKLPPSMLIQVAPTVDFLRSLEVSASVMARREKGAKQWQNKELEKNLAVSLVFQYRQLFGKPPSAANGSSFRRFTARISKILGYELGANIVSDACNFIRRFEREAPALMSLPLSEWP